MSYSIENIVRRINESSNIDLAVKELEIAYGNVIRHYADDSDKTAEDKLSDDAKNVVLFTNNEPHFWNCVNITDEIKGQILWISINPSGDDKDDNKRTKRSSNTKNVKFNLRWDETVSNKSKYWSTLKNNIIGHEKQIGHIDILPIHKGFEPELIKLFFTQIESPEKRMVTDLIRCTQALIEKIAPKIIIYSNKTSDWLWSVKPGIPWMGYKMELCPEKQQEIIKMPGKGRLWKYPHELYKIVGIENSISHITSSNLDGKVNGEGTYIVMDNQIGSQYHQGLDNASVRRIIEQLM